MNYQRKKKFAEKFSEWLANSKTCTINVTRDKETDIMVYEVVENAQDGSPLNTICYETVMDCNNVIDGWIDVLTKKCEKRLLFDGFQKVGIGDAETLEELELKFEIASE